MNALDVFLNRITFGDCVELMRPLPDACVDFVLTDPPYLVDYTGGNHPQHWQERDSKVVDTAKKAWDTYHEGDEALYHDFLRLVGTGDLGDDVIHARSFRNRLVDDIQLDFDGCAVGKMRHLAVGQDAAHDALRAVAVAQLVAGLEMKLLGTAILWGFITVYFFKWFQTEERENVDVLESSKLDTREVTATR